MNKHDFIAKLRAKLSGLPDSDVRERLGFYSEMIDDRIEEGLSEEAAVSEIGSVDDIAARLGEKKEAVVRAMEAIVEPISLYEPVFNESSGDSVYVIDQVSDAGSSEERWLENIVLREAMLELSEREQKIIRLRYYMNKTQMEIAEEIGISQAQVSRLEKGALNRIRAKI